MTRRAATTTGPTASTNAARSASGSSDRPGRRRTARAPSAGDRGRRAGLRAERQRADHEGHGPDQHAEQTAARARTTGGTAPTAYVPRPRASSSHRRGPGPPLRCWARVVDRSLPGRRPPRGRRVQHRLAGPRRRPRRPGGDQGPGRELGGPRRRRGTLPRGGPAAAPGRGPPGRPGARHRPAARRAALLRHGPRRRRHARRRPPTSRCRWTRRSPWAPSWPRPSRSCTTTASCTAT